MLAVVSNLHEIALEYHLDNDALPTAEEIVEKLDVPVTNIDNLMDFTRDYLALINIEKQPSKEKNISP